MAHLTDDELKELKTRVITAMGTGATIARSSEYLYQLIVEVEEKRAGGAPAKPKIGKITGAELDVKKAVPEAPPTTPGAVAENLPTVPITPEESKALVEKTKQPEGGKGKGGKKDKK